MNKTLSQKLRQLYNSNKLPWTIICIGIALRLIRYFHNPSLWFDESRNALGIINQSFSTLFPPSPDQTLSLPFGFVILEKFTVEMLGYSEYVLKLIPLVFGISALLFFYRILKQYSNPKAVPIALGLFAFLDPLIYLSSTLKPYTVDMFIVLLLYAAANYTKSKKIGTLPAILLGGLGAVAVWFSHPSIFILAGIGITLGMSCCLKKEWAEMRNLLVVFLVWLSSFVAVYFLYTQPLMYNLAITNNTIFWFKQNAFMPMPPMSLSDIQWFIDLPKRIFAFPVGLTFTGIAALGFIAGCIVMFSEKKENFFILILPLIITLLASGFQMYVFAQTALIFLVPSIIIFIAEGTEYIRDKLSCSYKAIGIVLVVLLFLHPVSWASYRAVKPNDREAIKPVLEYIKKDWREGDILYVYYMSQFAFEYYSTYHPGDYLFEEGEYIIGKGPQDWYATYKVKEFKGFWDEEKPFSQPPMEILKEYEGELAALRGNKRVWVLFSSKVVKAGMHEEQFFVYTLKGMGKQIDFFGIPGVSAVYLYDLSVKQKSNAAKL